MIDNERAQQPSNTSMEDNLSAGLTLSKGTVKEILEKEDGDNRFDLLIEMMGLFYLRGAMKAIAMDKDESLSQLRDLIEDNGLADLFEPLLGELPRGEE